MFNHAKYELDYSRVKSITCTTSSPLITRPKTIWLSFKSGIGAVVINSSNPLVSLSFEVPTMNASCFGLVVHQTKIKSLFNVTMNTTKILAEIKQGGADGEPDNKSTMKLPFCRPLLSSCEPLRTPSLKHIVFYYMMKRHSFEIALLTANQIVLRFFKMISKLEAYTSI